MDRSLEAYKEMLLDENYFLFVAKDNNEVVGSALGICCMGLTVPFLVIEDVIVKDGNRGKGIGRRIMESLDEFAKNKRCTYAILYHQLFEKVHINFMKKLGL